MWQVRVCEHCQHCGKLTCDLALTRVSEQALRQCNAQTSAPLTACFGQGKYGTLSTLNAAYGQTPGGGTLSGGQQVSFRERAVSIEERGGGCEESRSIIQWHGEIYSQASGAPAVRPRSLARVLHA